MINISATTGTDLRSLNYLKVSFYKNNLEKNKYLLVGGFQCCYFKTLNPHAFKKLVKNSISGDL